MADSVVKSAVDKLEEMALQEVKLQSEVGKKVLQLKDELEWLRTFLRDADRRRRQQVDDYIELWVRQTREVAFDVEDLLEEFFHKGELHCHGCFDLPSFLQWLKHSSAGLFTRHAIFDDIESINKRLESIKNKKEEYKLENLTCACKTLRKHYTDWSTLNERDIEEHLVARESDYKTILKQLLDENEKQQTVIAITGKSGIGKTTLASYIYGRSYVRAHFNCVIWVHAIQQACGATIQQACSATERKVTRSEENIKKELLEKLEGKKYLIVLDDVQSWEEWNFFVATLPSGSKGSRVLITTQLTPTTPSKEPGETEGTRGLDYCHHSVELKKLPGAQGTELFCKRVFGNTNSYNPFPTNKLEKLLQGLPLNIVLLAGLLRSKKKDEWENVINNLLSSTDEAAVTNCAEQQPQEQQQKQQPQQLQKQQPTRSQFQNLAPTEKILTLCLDDLPPHLKPCFLYFAAFKAEASINAGKLVRLWVAEGFMQPKDGRTMEECGQDYLKELISRCLVHLVEMDSSRNIVTVSIHQCVLDFAQSEARDTNFLRVHSSTDNLAHGTVRRLSLQNTYDTHINVALTAPKLHSLLCHIPEAVKDESSVRSFWHARKLWKKAQGLIKGRAIKIFSIHGSKFLRVMDLKGVEHRHTLPEEIGWLIHLRYLGLAHTSLKWLPKSIRKLRNLQTLDITNTAIEVVPRGFWRIRTLRHVLAGRLLDGPKEFHVLTDVQTLHGVPWGKWAQHDTALKRMTNLRSLRAWKLSRAAASDALLSALTGLECLTSMDLEGEEGTQLPLHKLLTRLSLRHLQYLRLHGKVMEPEVMPVESHQYLLPNLTKLELYKSGSGQALIDILAKLPNLVELVLGEGSYVHNDMAIPVGAFPKVRKIQLRDLPLQKCFVEEDGSALLQLEHMSIFRCAKLETLPKCLEQLRHLKLFTIHESPKIEKELLDSKDFSRKPHIVRGDMPSRKRLTV